MRIARRSCKEKQLPRAELVAVSTNYHSHDIISLSHATERGWKRAFACFKASFFRLARIARASTMATLNEDAPNCHWMSTYAFNS